MMPVKFPAIFIGIFLGTLHLPGVGMNANFFAFFMGPNIRINMAVIGHLLPGYQEDMRKNEKAGGDTDEQFSGVLSDNFAC